MRPGSPHTGRWQNRRSSTGSADSAQQLTSQSANHSPKPHPAGVETNYTRVGGNRVIHVHTRAPITPPDPPHRARPPTSTSIRSTMGACLSAMARVLAKFSN